MKKFFLLALMLCSIFVAKADENLITVKPVTIDKGIDIESEDCGKLEVYLKGTKTVAAVNFDLWIPNVLTFNPSYVYEGDILPYVEGKKGKKTYDHTIDVQAYPDAKQTLDGYTKYLVNVYATNGASFSENSGLLMSFDLGSVSDGADGLYTIYINNQSLNITSTENLANVATATSYVVYGDVDTPIFNAEGIIGTDVISNLDSGLTIDFSNATAVYGTCANNVNAKYTRTVSNEWNTICLPYNVTSGSDVYYKITDVKDDAIVATPVTTLAAGTPALVKTEESTITANAESVTLSATNVTDETAGTMVGTFEPIKVEDTSAYYIKDNKFWKCNENFNLKAFRAYFKAASSGAKSDVLTIEEGNATSINSVNSEGESEVYGIDGIRKNNTTKGINVVKMSDGKVMKVIIK